VAASQPPAPWILGLHALARLPQLDPAEPFLPYTQHRMYPFPDTGTIVVRRAYRKLYDLLMEREQSGITGGMVVGSPGIGLKALLCYLIKRYLPLTQTCSMADRSHALRSADNLLNFLCRSGWLITAGELFSAAHWDRTASYL